MQKNRKTNFKPNIKPRCSLIVPPPEPIYFNQSSSNAPLRPFEKSIVLLQILKTFEQKITKKRQTQYITKLELMQSQNALMDRIVKQQKLARTAQLQNKSMVNPYGITSDTVLAELDMTNNDLYVKLQKENQDLSIIIADKERKLEKMLTITQKKSSTQYLVSVENRLITRKDQLMKAKRQYDKWMELKKFHKQTVLKEIEDITQQLKQLCSDLSNKQAIHSLMSKYIIPQ